MLRKSLALSQLPMTVAPRDKKRCRWIANFVIIQCVLVFAGSFTILQCFWSPDQAGVDLDKLARIMYLYDYKACGYKLRIARALSDIRLPNQTYGLQVLPIKWQRAVITVSTRLSWKTRQYIDASVLVHVVWMVIAILLNVIMHRSKNFKLIKFALFTFLYVSVGVVMFDVSMAFVYVAHIQQSITKGMVLRYSGWSVELMLKNYDEFAGWIPIAASALWMRGIIILAWNIYCCRFINNVCRKIRNREVRRRLLLDDFCPIPEPNYDLQNDKTVLYYRAGENKPVIGHGVRGMFFN